MKKCVVLASLIISLSVHADNYWWKNSFCFTTNEVVAVSNIVSESAAVMEAKTIFLENYGEVRNFTWNSILVKNWIPWQPFTPNKYTKAQLKEIDSAFGSAGVRCRYWALPSCFTNEVLSVIRTTAMRNIALKYHEIDWQSIDIYELEEVCLIFNTEISESYFPNRFKIWQLKAINAYLIEVKRYLHKNGKSFLTKNGVNPLQPYMDKFVSALNAPWLDGVNECFAEIGRVDCTLDLSKLPSDNEIAGIVHEILNFTRPFPTDALSKFKLLIGLGTDGYNNLVREYNGEE